MMISLGLLSSCSPAIAENYYSAKPVICGAMKDIIGTSKSFGEIPILRGDGVTMNDNGTFAPSYYIIAFNEETGSWTLIEILSTGHACVLGSGTSLSFFAKEKGIEL